MEKGRGFKVLSISPCSYQNRSQRVSRKPKFTFDLLHSADFMSVPDVGTAMICAAFVKAYSVCTESRGGPRPHRVSGIEII